MSDSRKTKAQLSEELAELRRRVAELEAAETEPERAAEAGEVRPPTEMLGGAARA